MSNHPAPSPFEHPPGKPLARMIRVSPTRIVVLPPAKAAKEKKP